MAIITNPTNLRTKRLKVSVTLDAGTFPDGQNTIVIDNTCTMDVEVTKTNGFTPQTANVTIYGLTHENIAAMSHISYKPFERFANTLVIEAGYAGSDENGINYPFGVIFKGQIGNAIPDYSDASRPFRIEGYNGWFGNLQMQPHLNIQGSTLVQNVLQTIVGGMGKSLTVNGDISGQSINNPIYTGGHDDQLRQVCQDCGLNYVSDDTNVSVAPFGVPLIKGIIEISPDDILLSYPEADQLGWKIRVRHNPQIQYGVQVKAKSMVITKSFKGDQDTDNTYNDFFVAGITDTLQNRHDKWESLLTLRKYLQGQV